MSSAGPDSSVRFLGVRFDRLDAESACRAIFDRAGAGGFSYVVTPNVDHVVRLHRHAGDVRFWSAYERAGLSLCDSRVLRGLARLSGLAINTVPGSDLTRDVLHKMPAGAELAVVGGDHALIEALRSLYPDARWHHHAPPLGVLHDPVAQSAIIEFVESCPARLFFFAIGSPQSELLCERIASRHAASGVGLCIGASLEFLTGAKARAPLWMQKASLEWLFRLATEPTRLWRRYLKEGPRIFLIWLRWTFRFPHRRGGSGSSRPGES